MVEPVDSVGVYGGVWHRAWRGVSDFHAFGRIIYDPVLRWPRDPSGDIQPGLADTWTFSDDGKALTLHFREGLKWSDGVPFTVDDVIFWWDAIETDPNVTAAIHSEWMVGGEPMTLEKIDDNTITLHFAAPERLGGNGRLGISWQQLAPRLRALRLLRAQALSGAVPPQLQRRPAATSCSRKKPPTTTSTSR